MLCGFQNCDHQTWHDKINCQLLPAAIQVKPAPDSGRTDSPSTLAVTRYRVKPLVFKQQIQRLTKLQ
jgi:hypothetical protein